MSRRSSRTSTSIRRSSPRRRPEDGGAPVKVLGIDPGTAVLGYGVVDNGAGPRPTLIQCGTLTTRPRDTLAARLRIIFEGVTELLATHAPDAMAVESVFYGRNVRSTVVLSHARGVILLAAEQAGVPITEYSPA